MTQSRGPRCASSTAAPRARALILGAGLLAAIATWAVAAGADEDRGSPVVAMRAAAEEAADTEPDQARLARRGVLPAQAARSEALHAAVRTAIRDEVEHVVRPGMQAPGRSGNSPAAGEGGGNGGGNGNGSGGGNGNGHGNGGLGQLHSAVSSAQQAKRNSAVQAERGQNRPKSGMAHGSPAGQSRASVLGTGSTR